MEQELVVENIEVPAQNMEDEDDEPPGILVAVAPIPAQNMEEDEEPPGILVAPMAALEVATVVAPVVPIKRIWNESGTQLDNIDVIKNVLPFLRKKQMKKLRLLSCNWNMIILDSLEFQFELSGRIRGVWYRKATGKNFQITPKWNSLHLHRFQFFRHSSQFRLYWQNAVEFLDTLTLCRMSLECDGFIFLLSNCPVLRVLTLDICKLRDLDDHHSEGAKRKPPRAGYNLPPEPITRDLSHLSLKSINRIEQCFMNYLIERTGHLESFQVASCFVPTEKDMIDKTNSPTPQFRARYEEFEGNVLKLLEKNEDELTQFTYTKNTFYPSFFGKIAARENFFNIRSLTLEVDTPDPNLLNYAEMFAFSAKCQGVENLSLKLHRDIPSVSLQNFLEPHRGTLRKLYIGVRGDIIRTPLNLDFLKDFALLDDFEIEDTKPLVLKKIRPIIGGNRLIDGLEVEESRNVVTELITNYGSKINPSFMNVLPPELKKLGLNHYITPIDPLRPIDPSVSTWQSLRKLSKLEIRGPWILTITGIIGAISTELIQLETLALTACGLEDTHLTGLDETIVQDMFNSTFAGMEVFKVNPNPTSEEVTNAVRGRMKPDTDWNAPRNRLSDLPNLKNLDLSLNPGITDIALFDALGSPRIKTLNLYSCTRISDDGMHFITLYLPGLEVLNVKHCRKVTRVGLNKLVESGPSLKTVYSTMMPAYGRDYRWCRSVGIGPQIVLHPRYEDIVVTTDEKYVGRLAL